MFTDEDSEDQAEVTACIHSTRSTTPGSMIPWWWGWQVTPSNHAPYSGAWAGRPGPSMGTAVGGNEWDTEKYTQTKGSTELGGRGARQALDLRVRWKCGSSDGAEKFGKRFFSSGKTGVQSWPCWVTAWITQVELEAELCGPSSACQGILYGNWCSITLHQGSKGRGPAKDTARERRVRPRKAWSDKNWWWAGMGEDFQKDNTHISVLCLPISITEDTRRAQQSLGFLSHSVMSDSLGPYGL